jgi:hypothetical protein
VGNAKDAGWTALGPVARRGRRGTRGLVAANSRSSPGSVELVGRPPPPFRKRSRSAPAATPVAETSLAASLTSRTSAYT